ncbi:MAG: HypC/HybG/HupF family hydrogenase formation chaperone [Candidatus Nezhaarchaeota archaeon]|nr:HypC/HybG/HupF family hydrogenase formation chaperone [Candidatus Nezhaarchaeota archaeon]
MVCQWCLATCLAIPGRVVEVKGEQALVDFGGVRRIVYLTLLPREVKPGDYVMVHTGFAIEVVDRREAEEVWRLLREAGVA